MVFFPPSRTFLLWTTLLLVLCGSGFFMLANGLHLNRITLPGGTATNVDLKWQDGLNLEIKHLQITPPADPVQLDEKHLRWALEAYRFLRKLIPSITVHSLDYDTYRLQILSRKQQAHLVTLNSDDLHLEAVLTRVQDNIRIEVRNLSSQHFNSSTRGLFLLNTKKLQINGEMSAELADCLPVQLSVTADPDTLSIQGKGTDATTTIKPLVALFKIDPDIQPWITDYLTGSRYQLQAFSATIPWENPAAILDTLTASVRVDDCEYSFARGLEPIKTDYTQVTFSGGVLDIRPYGSTFYGQEGKKSRLDINFNDPDNILLTVRIKTRARLNRSLVALLKYYDIDLPLLQTEGTTAADLTLVVNLNSEEVRAAGSFEVGKSLFAYEGTAYRVTEGRIDLKDADIVLHGLEIGLHDFFTARISGKLQPRKSRTDLEIEVNMVQIPLKDTLLTLNHRDTLQLSYHSSPGGSWITAAPSRWLLGATALQLDAFSTPFDVRQMAGKLPPTRLVVPAMMELSLAGDFDLKKPQADLEATILHLQIQSLGLNQKALTLAVRYDNQLTVTTTEPSSWLLAGLEMTLSPFSLSYTNDLLKLENMRISSVDLFDTLVKGTYDLNGKQGRFLLKELLFSRKDRTPFLKFPDELGLTLEINQGMTRINLEQLGLSLHSVQPGGWDVNISDMGKLLDRSPLLRRLKISRGKFHLTTTTPSSPLQFTGEVSSAYALLVQNGFPQSDYVFSGDYDESGFNLVVNNDLHVRYNGTITIHSRNIGYNVPAILRFDKDRAEQDGTTADLVLRAENSFLFFRPVSRILADSMTLTVRGNRRDLKIFYGPGELVVKMIDDTFSLQGHDLNDRFMNELIPDAEFENGYLTAFAEGTFDKFTAALHTDAILLKNYATLNNILAVINTLPALVTFSLPHYATDGWPVDSIRMWFNYEQGIATVKTLELDSPEMDMRGTGTIDPINQQISLDVNMITQAGKNMSKIPVIGYILAGEEERPTLTFHVTGDLLDPDVESTAFEEIITSPFDMVLRTLATPFKWAEDLFGQDQPDLQRPVEKEGQE